MSKKTIPWINSLKALCIIAVYLEHCQAYYVHTLDFGNQFINPWYVNAFFFVSGYLLFWKQLSSPKIDEPAVVYAGKTGGKLLLNNIFFRIMIPSVLFAALEFFPKKIIKGEAIDLWYALYKTIGGGTYWFTSSLVVAELILLMLFCTRRRNIWFYAVACLVIGITGLTIVHFDILKSGIWAWRQGLIALVFLAMGGLYWKLENKFRVQSVEFSVESSSKANVGKRSRMLRILSPLLLAAAYVATVVLLKDYNDPLISTLTIQPLGFVTSAMACLLLVWLCKKLPEVKPLTFIGQNSLGFYFMSGALPITFSMIAHKVLSGSSVWVMLAIWIACLVTAYLAVKLINRWLPWLWDLRLWGKG